MNRCLGILLTTFGSLLILEANGAATQTQCANIKDSERFDCYPEPDATEEKCQARGCCWNVMRSRQYPKQGTSIGVPLCYYPADFPSYEASAPKSTSFGFTVNLKRTIKTYYPADVMQLQLDVYLETSTRLHFKIYDPNNVRYEVPVDTPKVSKKCASQDYAVKVTQKPFGLVVTRQSTGKVLFNSSVSGLMFADQFIQLSTSLASPYIYGLGEHRSSSFLHSLNFTRLTFWSRDIPPQEDTNLYGVHPFYLALEEDGNSHGVFLLNSNAMDVILQPLPALTYRTIGGVLDFYVFLGPEPDQVVQGYLEVIGWPMLPPYWGLGFHLCRWGYETSNDTRAVVQRMKAAGIPQDIQWNDIDYMREHLDFTFDPTRYHDLPDLVRDLHAGGQHYIMIIDPGISKVQPSGTYPPYDEGLLRHVFVNDTNNNPIVGQVWPGKTVFPDFSNPDTVEWWQRQVQGYHDLVPFDGLWTDMNEPSNFVSGSVDGCPQTKWDQPPFTPAVRKGKLCSQTLCASAKQHLALHYNLHSLYGHFETIASNKALSGVRVGKRPFVISRSTFPSSGKFGGHWLGDNSATWKDMYYSIPGILNFNLFGVPLVGADICGFKENTTEQLCQRWHQLGAFYPFSRNHNSLYCDDPSTYKCKDQDPASFSPAMQASTRSVLLTRYSLLPYLYTLFYQAHTAGNTVARPLFFEYPKDVTSYSVDTQFLWGSALLITPVLTEGATSVQAYFPQDAWYDFYTGQRLSPVGKKVTLEAPLDHLPLHLRGGHVIPTQEPATTTAAARNNSFGLIVALPDGGRASLGQLYWDNGDDPESYASGNYTLLAFTADQSGVTSQLVHAGYGGGAGQQPMRLGSVKVYGLGQGVTSVTVNGKAVTTYQYDSGSKVLSVSDLAITIHQSPFTIKWQ